MKYQSKFLHQSNILSVLQHLPSQMKLLTSAGKNMQLSICLATFSPSLDGRSHRMTLAPCLVNLSTVARPSPEAPPLTKLTNPYKTTANETSVINNQNDQPLKKPIPCLLFPLLAQGIGFKKLKFFIICSYIH